MRLARKALYRVIPALVLTVALAPPLVAPQKREERAPRPKLVVMLVVDQMRADYLTTYRKHWSRGLARLLDEGAWFENAEYPYLNTVTCAGHATISTGTYPATHGMILNAWWDRDRRRTLPCTEDDDARMVSYGRPLVGGASARNLLAPAFAEELRQQSSGKRPRVVSISIKARSAIMLAGHKADTVVWFETSRGIWVSSSVYGRNGSHAVRQFVRQNPVDDDYGKVWEHLLPADQYIYADWAGEEQPAAAGWQSTFPHILRGRSGKPDALFYNSWRMSPYSDAYLAKMAQYLVNAEKLGRRGATDFLAISFSALDTVGHEFGPRSHEVQDVMARLDVAIGDLLDQLDRTLGKGNYIVGLSSDHGVATIPEHMSAEGNDAGRVRNTELASVVESVLARELGPEKYVQRSLYTDFYFQPGVYEKLSKQPAALQSAIDAIMKVPGVWRVYRGEELAAKRNSEDHFERAAALSYFPGRSGDLVVIPKPNWFFAESSGSGSTHGTAHWYDSRVPVILMGYGIRAGKYSAAATPADLAPTLAHICRIQLKAADGRVLTEALATSAAAPSVAQ